MRATTVSTIVAVVRDGETVTDSDPGPFTVRTGDEIVVENVGYQARGLPLSVLGDIARDTGTSVCFDVGHAYMEDGDEGIERFLEEYGGLVAHLHVHDVRGRGDTHLPIGAGEISHGRLSARLLAYDGSVAVEVFTDDVPLGRDTARRVEDHLGGRRDSESTG